MNPIVFACSESGECYEFPIDRSDQSLLGERRERVIPHNHPVRTPDYPGVYVFLSGDRCLYVGKASRSTLTGRALDYLYQAGDRDRVYAVIRTHADRLFIRKCADDAAARRNELELIVQLRPMLNEGFIYATPEERNTFQLWEKGQGL